MGMGETFGARLLREILARYPSRRQFAKAIDMEPAYLTRILKDKVRSEDETIERLAKGLGLPMMEVLSWRVEAGGENRLVERRSSLHARGVPAPDLDIIPPERIQQVPRRESAPFVSFPLHDIMAADHGRTADSQLREMVGVPPELIDAARRPVVIRASGDCLALRRILTGDLVVCDARRTARENDIVAFRFQGYAGLKIYREEGERIALCPSIESREFQAIYVPKDQVADLDIVGVAIGVVAQDGRNWWRL